MVGSYYYIRTGGLLQTRVYCSKMAEAMPCEGAQTKSTDDSENTLGVETDTASVSDGPRSPQQKKPICVLVLGMAGSGKTTFVQVDLILSRARLTLSCLLLLALFLSFILSRLSAIVETWIHVTFDVLSFFFH